MKTSTSIPVYITAYYAVEGCAATVQFNCINSPALDVTVTHESLSQVKAYELSGHDLSDPLTCNDGECFSISVREDGHIIASALLVVDVSLPERLEAVLCPTVTTNMVFNQCESAEIFEIYDTRPLPEIKQRESSDVLIIPRSQTMYAENMAAKLAAEKEVAQ